MDAVAMAAVLQKAEAAKQAGNKALQAREYKTADGMYSQAMTVLLTAMQKTFDTLSHDQRAAMDLTAFTEPLSVIYSNWSELYLKWAQVDPRHYPNGMLNSTAALFYNPRNFKAWHRAARALEGIAKLNMYYPACFATAAAAACERSIAVLTADAAVQPPDAAVLEHVQQDLQRLKSLATRITWRAPPITALCASHISNELRYCGLLVMLRTWACQDYPVPLHLSLSFDPVQFTREQQEQHAADLRSSFAGLQLTVYLRDQPLTQGQHYQQLLADLQELQIDSNSTWVIFTDDDDIWNPTRASHYADWLAKRSNTLGSSNVISIMTKLSASSLHNSHLKIWGPRLVALNLEDGKNATKMIDWTTSGIYHEHYNHCVRLSALRHFFSLCEPDILAHKYWDLCLVKFLEFGQCKYEVEVPRTTPPDHTWMYCHLNAAVGHNIGGVVHTHTDLRDQIWNEAEQGRGDTTKLVDFEAHAALELACASWCTFNRGRFMESIASPTFNKLPAALREQLVQKCFRRAEQLLQEPGSIYQRLLNSPVSKRKHLVWA